MDALLLTSRVKAGDHHDFIKPSRTSTADQLDISKAKTDPPTSIEADQALDIASPDDVYKALGSKPTIQTVLQVLKWLDETEKEFRWKIPSPKAARITNLVVNNVLPDHWLYMQSDESSIHKKARKLFLRFLTSLTGIGALVTRLQSLLMHRKNGQQSPDAKTKIRTLAAEEVKTLQDVTDVLQGIFAKEDMLSKFWDDFEGADIKPLQRGLLQREAVNLLAGSRVLSVSAEAFAATDELSPEVGSHGWVGNGQQYALWLARSLKNLVLNERERLQDSLRQITACFKRAMSLGYPEQIVRGFFWDPANVDSEKSSILYNFLDTLQIEMQRTVLYSLIRIMSKESTIRTRSESTPETNAHATSAISAFLSAFIRGKSHFRDFLAEWVSNRSSGSSEVDECSRRAVIVVLAQHKVTTKSLLLVAGYVSRTNLVFLKSVAQSSQWINAISSRIAASSPRAKFLGMVVGNAITSAASPEEKKLIFGGDEMSGAEAQKYSDWMNVEDCIGSIQDLESFFRPHKPPRNVSNAMTKRRSEAKKPGPTSKIIAIEEINESSESEDDDLPMYEKPDSDPEDEDSDPELIQRNKPTAPVYIRDLIKGLGDTENYDRHKLALATASSLIRRKAHFGTEVADHIEELATQLTGLGDKYSMDDFPKLRLQAMIAIFIAQPLQMGQWYSRTYFNGDYSIAQRASILTTMTMGARELAGFKKEDGDLTGANALPENPFPSKRMPDKMHRLWAVEAAPVNSLTQSLQRQMIKPIAAEAADQAAGPKILQVRTFSSRMEVEKRRKKPIANELAKIVAEGLFFPLTARWQNNLQAYGARSAHTSPFLLSHFLKTLALLLHASGPSTLSLPQMTREFWALLLSLRTMATEDVLILEGLLFSFITLLDVNEDKRRMAEDFSTELLETQSWVQNAFDGMKGGSAEGERSKMLAAGILVGTGEVVDKYQKLMMGELLNYT